jgi:response regulator RpfG family c-di-GMP phosphodiesterase
LYASFAEEFCEALARVDPETRNVFVNIVTTLKDTKFHIRMALVNLNWIVQG